MAVEDKFAQLRQLQQRLGYGPNAGTSMWSGKPRKELTKQKKYMDIYNKLLGKGEDLSGFGTFDLKTQTYNQPNPYGVAVPTDSPPGVAVGAGDDIIADNDMGLSQNPYAPDPQNPATSEWPYGPSTADINQTMATGLPPGININTEKGAKAAEVMFPYVQQAYDVEMDKMAIETGVKSLEDYKDDPILNQAAAMTSELMANPYTFDDQTVELMRNRVRDQTATEEAALGERLRSMGVTLGTDSPAFANLASQASLVRDLNRAAMERDLDIRMAAQNMSDRYRAAGAGGQFGGAYQAGLAGRYGNLMSIQGGQNLAGNPNPFAGLWQGMMMADEITRDPSHMQEYGGLYSGLLGVASSAVQPSPTYQPSPT
jgi:hypothetical protein